MITQRKIAYSIGVLLFIIAAVLFVINIKIHQSSLEVIFLDVGQGDAILISQGNQQILIDGGADGTLLLEKIGKYIPFWDRTIEVVVATHPDQDHIGGLIKILQTYRISTFVHSNIKGSSQVAKKVDELSVQKAEQIMIAQKDEVFTFPQGGDLKILFPFDDKVLNSEDTNAASVVARLDYGNNSFLLTGDLPSAQEQELISRHANVIATFLKVAHHGSKYSTGDDFLNTINSKEAIISVGKNNTYGHPNQETLGRLSAHHMKILRTDQIGDIEFDCRDLEHDCVQVN